MILSETVQEVIIIDDQLDFAINVSMLVVTILSVVCAFLVYSHQRKRSKKDAACRLAEHYANVILDEHSFVSNVYRMTGLDGYIRSTIAINAMNDFDKLELTGLLKNKAVDYGEFMRKINDISPSVVLQCRLLQSKSPEERKSICTGFLVRDPESGEERILNESYLLLDLEQDVSDLLNKLEYFSMNCRYGLADEEILYQSLHQTFISLVWILYPTISSRNINNEDKLYTNVIWLFQKWRKRLTKITDKTKKKKLAMERKAAAAQKRAEKVQQKAERVRAKVFTGSGLK